MVSLVSVCCLMLFLVSGEFGISMLLLFLVSGELLSVMLFLVSGEFVISYVISSQW